MTEIKASIEQLKKAHKNLSAVWLGDDFVIELLISAILAKGHILLVDVPGVGKTTLAKGLAQILGLSFNRIQFTNDILPSDILGGSVYNPQDGKFSFSPGPIFTDFLLADEINRAPTRSQSAFLQAMEEGFVAIDGENHSLSSLFTVVATQNPIDFDSTNPLPEAQLDRFLVSISLGYPDTESEVYLLDGYSKNIRQSLDRVLTRGAVESYRESSKNVYLHPDLARYITQIARETRKDSRVKLGISPRGSIHLANISKAFALINGRSEVLPQDIQKLIHPVWNHRLLPKHGRDYDGSLSNKIIHEVMEKVPVPR